MDETGAHREAGRTVNARGGRGDRGTLIGVAISSDAAIVGSPDFGAEDRIPEEATILVAGLCGFIRGIVRRCRM